MLIHPALQTSLVDREEMDDMKENLGSGAASFISHTPETRFMRSATKFELQNKVKTNCEDVFKRLRIHSVTDAFADACFEIFNQDHSMSIQVLKNIVATAELENEADEKAMYTHLGPLFDHIVSFQSNTAAYHRQIYNTHNKDVKGEQHISNFPSLSPDFLYGTKKPTARGQRPTWREASGFIEIKPKSAQGIIPKGTKADVLVTLAQTADYARLHLSSRPFQLFSVAVILSGSKVAVAIFDRDGVMVSPEIDMWNDMRIFIKIIRQIVCGLSPIELGEDPTIRMVEEKSPLYASIRPKEKALGVPEDSTGFPSFHVTCPRQLRSHTAAAGMQTVPNTCAFDTWVTIGPPIWSSLSLCGRATTVWRVTRMDGDNIPNINEVYILKNSWRSSDRDSESDLYQSIPIRPVGVAEFLQGGDVMVPNSVNIMCVDYLRTLPGQAIPPPSHSTPILHRLILKTMGRALWDCNNYLELIKVVRAALRGHRDLCNQNILHRDISPGNVLLSVQASPSDGQEGFLTDLDFARVEHLIQRDTIQTDDGGQSTRTQYNSEKLGVVMTGTLHFMALQLLEATELGIDIEHQAHHDVESFIWVLAYAVARRLINSNSKADEPIRKCISDFYKNSWGGATLHIVRVDKGARSPLLLPALMQPFIPPPILTLFASFRGLLIAQVGANEANGPPVLTHSIVLAALDRCIADFESPAYGGLR